MRGRTVPDYVHNFHVVGLTPSDVFGFCAVAKRRFRLRQRFSMQPLKRLTPIGPAGGGSQQWSRHRVCPTM